MISTATAVFPVTAPLGTQKASYVESTFAPRMAAVREAAGQDVALTQDGRGVGQERSLGDYFFNEYLKSLYGCFLGASIAAPISMMVGGNPLFGAAAGGGLGGAIYLAVS